MAAFIVLYTLTLAIQIVIGQNPCFDETVWEDAVFCPESSTQKILTDDYNGDGRVDLNCVDNEGTMLLLYISPNCSYTIMDPAYAYFGLLNGGCPSGDWHSGDFDGDGKADVLCRNGRDIRIDFYGPNGTFDNNVTFHDVPSGCGGRHDKFVTGDFNGDGIHDLFCYRHTANQIKITLLQANQEMEEITTDVDAGWCSTSARLYKGNFNNDNRTDVLCMSKAGQAKIYLSKNTNYIGKDAASRDLLIRCRTKKNQVIIGDFNSDGTDDILCRRSDRGRHYIYYSDEDGISTRVGDEEDFSWCGLQSMAGLYAGDADGDGTDDLICSNWDELRNGDLTVHLNN